MNNTTATPTTSLNPAFAAHLAKCEVALAVYNKTCDDAEHTEVFSGTYGTVEAHARISAKCAAALAVKRATIEALHAAYIAG